MFAVPRSSFIGMEMSHLPEEFATTLELYITFTEGETMHLQRTIVRGSAAKGGREGQ